MANASVSQPLELQSLSFESNKPSFVIKSERKRCILLDAQLEHSDLYNLLYLGDGVGTRSFAISSSITLQKGKERARDARGGGIHEVFAFAFADREKRARRQPKRQKGIKLRIQLWKYSCLIPNTIVAINALTVRHLGKRNEYLKLISNAIESRDLFSPTKPAKEDEEGSYYNVVIIAKALSALSQITPPCDTRISGY